MKRYDATAWMYDSRYAEEQEAKYAVALESVDLNTSSTVLDLGCGSGLFFAHVAGKVSTIIGLDVSRKLLFLAHHRSKKLLNAHLILADADNLPFKPTVFNLVFAFTVLQNTPDPAQTLEEVNRVSKVDASVIVTGLKAALTLDTLSNYLETAGLHVTSLRNDEKLKCHVLTCIKSR